MKKITRRQFTKRMAAAAGASSIIRSFGTGKNVKRLPIAFSTLGCPGWDWKKILDQSSQLGYTGIELRGLLNEMDLPKSPQFTGAKLNESLKDLDALGLKISDLGASSRLGEPDPTKRADQIDEARRFIDLANKLKSPYVRVFGGKLAKGQTMEDSTARVIEGFRRLSEHAKGSGVTLIIESHDEYSTSQSLLNIMKELKDPTAAILWDAHHTFAAGKETPAETYKLLGKLIRHTHLKDSRPVQGDVTERRYVLLGQGEVPVKDTVKVLAAAGYKGYYCFEWEKRWHPEIEEPEIAFPQYAKVMREYLAEAGIKA